MENDEVLIHSPVHTAILLRILQSGATRRVFQKDRRVQTQERNVLAHAQSGRARYVPWHSFCKCRALSGIHQPRTRKR